LAHRRREPPELHHLALDQEDPLLDLGAVDRRVVGEDQILEIVGSVLEAVSGADAAVIVTEWGELRGLASEEVREAMRNPLIIDGRNLLDPARARRAGFAYEGIGRAVSPLDVLPETPERELSK